MWFETSTWRNLVDMHIPDWDDEFLSCFSPEVYADAMAVAKVDTALLYAGNCLGICFWPTKVGHMHASLKGRDICLETYHALRNRGIDVVIYYNIWSRWAYDTHPAWRIRRVDGTDTLQNRDGSASRFGQCCINQDGYRAYVYDQITDLCKHFPDAKGLWIDMIGYFGTLCYCPACRERFLRETGLELPERVDWNNIDFVRFQRAREQWLAEFAAEIRRVALAVNAGLTLAFQSTTLLNGWLGGASQMFLNQSDYLAGDFYGSALQYSALCKYLSNLSAGRPMEFMTSRCYDLSYHTTTKTDAELLHSARGAYAHNAAFLFIDAIDPSGTLDTGFYERMGHLKNDIASYARTVGSSARVYADVAFYRNTESNYNPERCGTPADPANTNFPLTRTIENIARTMANTHTLFDIIGLPQLQELSRYQAVVVAGQHMLSGAEVSALLAYAHAGGRLIVVGDCGRRYPDGRLRDDFPFASATGVHYIGKTDEDCTYIAPTAAGQAHFEAHSEHIPLGLRGKQLLVSTEPDVTVLATITLPWSASTDIHRFGSAISNPPAKRTDFPAITERSFGKGSAMFIASALDSEFHKPQRRVFASLIRRGLAVSLDTDAPEWLEIIVLRDADACKYRLSALSIASDAANLHVPPVAISLTILEKVLSVRDVATNHELAFMQQGKVLRFTTEAFVDFTMLEIEWKE
jgi:hypothetical protein